MDLAEIGGGGVISITGNYVGSEYYIKEADGSYWLLDTARTRLAEYTSYINYPDGATGTAYYFDDLVVDSYDSSTGAITISGPEAISGTLVRGGLGVVKSFLYNGFAADADVTNAIADIDTAINQVNTSRLQIRSQQTFFLSRASTYDIRIGDTQDDIQDLINTMVDERTAKIYAEETRLHATLFGLSITSEQGTLLIESLLLPQSRPPRHPRLHDLSRICRLRPNRMTATPSRQVDQQHLAVGFGGDFDRRDLGDGGAGTDRDRGAVDHDPAARRHHIGAPAAVEHMAHRVARRQGGANERRVLMDWQGVGVAGAARGQDHQLPGAGTLGERPRRPGRGQALPVVLDPDLEDPGLLVLEVVLGMDDAGAGGHHLHVAGGGAPAVAAVVHVGDGAGAHIGDDLHVAVRMRVEPGAGADGIVVPDPERPESHAPRVVVGAEAEMVLGIEPVILEPAQTLERAYLDHRSSGHHQATALVPLAKVDDRPQRHDPVRINGFVAAVIMLLDMVEVHGLGDPRYLV